MDEEEEEEKQKNKRTRAETSLKASIIEFMRHRPFLWNPRHPSYKDNKRRDAEFQQFAGQMGCPVREIKRVWHVLRTNFFRAHKLMLDRPPPSEPGRLRESGLWKYYLAMEYILKGKDDGFLVEHQAESSSTSDSCSPAPMKIVPDSSQSLSGRLGVDSSVQLNNQASDGNQDESHSHNSNSNNCHSNLNLSLSLNKTPAFERKLARQTSLPYHASPQACGYFYSMEDGDYMYARSLCATLRRFDFKTRELIKLKFQEIIVSQTQQLQHDEINVLH